MKKLLLALGLAGALSTAFAAEPYVFATVGHGTLSGSGVSESATGGGVGLGLKFNKYVGAEVGYDYLGQSQGLTADAYSASLVGRYELAPEVVGRIKVGVANTGVYKRVDSAQVGVRGNDAVVGVGVEYALNNAVNVVGEYEYFNDFANGSALGVNAHVNRFSVGLQYCF